MTEARFCDALRVALRTRRPYGAWIKLADRATKGLPDATWTERGRTLWLEAKVLKRGETLTARVAKQPLQRATLVRLARASEGRAFYVVRRPDATVELVEPVTLAGRRRGTLPDIVEFLDSLL